MHNLFSMSLTTLLWLLGPFVTKLGWYQFENWLPNHHHSHQGTYNTHNSLETYGGLDVSQTGQGQKEVTYIFNYVKNNWLLCSQWGPRVDCLTNFATRWCLPFYHLPSCPACYQYHIIHVSDQVENNCDKPKTGTGFGPLFGVCVDETNFSYPEDVINKKVACLS